MDKLDNERLGALIIAVAQGDVGAVEQIYNLMGRVMYAVAASYLRELADIEDAVQTALLTIVRKADRFRENKNAYAWVNTIVKNTALNLRAAKGRRTALEVSEIKQHSFSAEMMDEALFVRQLLSVLTEHERDVVYYRFWYGLSLSEIGQAVRKSKSAVKKTLDRALLKMEKFADN